MRGKNSWKRSGSKVCTASMGRPLASCVKHQNRVGDIAGCFGAVVSRNIAAGRCYPMKQRILFACYLLKMIRRQKTVIIGKLKGVIKTFIALI